MSEGFFFSHPFNSHNQPSPPQQTSPDKAVHIQSDHVMKFQHPHLCICDCYIKVKGGGVKAFFVCVTASSINVNEQRTIILATCLMNKTISSLPKALSCTKLSQSCCCCRSVLPMASDCHQGDRTIEQVFVYIIICILFCSQLIAVFSWDRYRDGQLKTPSKL